MSSSSTGTMHRIAVAVVLALVLFTGLLPVSPASAATGDVGVHDFSYAGASAPTGQKPQSKLWYTPDGWFGVLWSGAAKQWRIHRFNWASDTWSDLGVVVDKRAKAQVDALWDEENQKLYVVAHIKDATTSSDMAAKLSRFSYTGGSYSADAGFPVALTSGSIEAVVIDRDSNGLVWSTWTVAAGTGRKVLVTHATSTANNAFVTPYTPPVSGADNLDKDDISTLVAYDGKIGVLWSNQRTDTVYFASHVDGASDAAWDLNPALSGPKYADDHLNIKSLSADPAGRVYAAVKTSLNDVNPSSSSQPLVLLLVLDGNGSWKRYTVNRINDGDQTRPIVLASPDTRTVHVFSAGPCCSGGTVYYKSTSLDRPDFATGTGDPFIKLASDTTINNPSSTKQAVTAASGILVIAGDDHTHFYVHNKIALQGGSGGGTDTTPPTASITAPAAGASLRGMRTIVAAASDNVGVSQVDFTVAGASAGSDTTAPYAVDYDFDGLPEGPVALAVQATDAAGNRSTTSSISVTVDRTAPQTTITSRPTDPSTSSSAAFSFTASETATFACSLDAAAYAACTSPTSFQGLANGSHTFSVRATDAAGNVDGTPATASWTVDVTAPTTLFQDGFESGSFSAWQTVTTAAGGVAVVQQAAARTGSYGAQLSETATSGSKAYVRGSLPASVSDATVTVSVRIDAEGASGGNVPLLRLYDAANARLLSVYRQNAAGDAVYAAWTLNGSTVRASAGKMPLGAWRTISVHVVTAGSASTVQVSIDGAQTLSTTTANLGTSGIKMVQLGNDTSAQAFSLVADDVSVR